MTTIALGALVGAAIGSVPALNAREPRDFALVGAFALFCGAAVAALMMAVGP